MMRYKVVRAATVPMSLNILLKGQLQFLNHNFDVIGLSSAGEELDEVGQREGVKTIAVDMERGISPIKDLVSLIRLFYVFKNEKPTIVHSITPKAGLLTMLASKFAGVPIRMHTFTGLIFPTKTGFLQKILIQMDRLLCWSATHIYPEGNGVKQDLLMFNITKKPLRVLANGNVNGVDLDYFCNANVLDATKCKLRAELGIDDKDFVYIFVGRLVNDKGINELIAAFEQLTIANVKLLLVGALEFSSDKLSEMLIQRISDNCNVISVGFQTDVRSYMAISNALVFPSYREGFPNVVLQAGAMGLPSIVTDINGSNEIIKDGINGLIVPVKDVNSLTIAMKNLAEHNKLYMDMKSKSRDSIASRFEQKFVWRSLQEEYKRLLIEKSLSHV